MDARRSNVTRSLPNSLIGRLTSFRIRDIHYPDPSVVLNELHGEDGLTGVVLDLSDSGVEPSVYAVIRVAQLSRPLVVPIERLLPAPESHFHRPQDGGAP